MLKTQFYQKSDFYGTSILNSPLRNHRKDGTPCELPAWASSIAGFCTSTFLTPLVKIACWGISLVSSACQPQCFPLVFKTCFGMLVIFLWFLERVWDLAFRLVMLVIFLWFFKHVLEFG